MPVPIHVIPGLSSIHLVLTVLQLWLEMLVTGGETHLMPRYCLNLLYKVISQPYKVPHTNIFSLLRVGTDCQQISQSEHMDNNRYQSFFKRNILLDITVCPKLTIISQ